MHAGNLVVHRDHADAVCRRSATLFAARFPIERIQLVDDFGADDAASMAANNTERLQLPEPSTASRASWSEHSYGWAIDINPVQNPWVRGIQVDPPAGVPYADRSAQAPGMIHAGDAWSCRPSAPSAGPGAATFRSAKDYQHFSATGR